MTVNPDTEAAEGLTLLEAMTLADLGADGQLRGYFDEETGEPLIDASDPCRDLHAAHVVETVAANHDPSASRDEALRSLAQVFRSKGGVFTGIAESFCQAGGPGEYRPATQVTR